MTNSIKHEEQSYGPPTYLHHLREGRIVGYPYAQLCVQRRPNLSRQEPATTLHCRQALRENGLHARVLIEMRTWYESTIYIYPTSPCISSLQGYKLVARLAYVDVNTVRPRVPA